MNEKTALRIADALESISGSLQQLANPPMICGAGLVDEMALASGLTPNSYAVDDYPYDISDKDGRVVLPKGPIKIPVYDPNLDNGSG